MKRTTAVLACALSVSAGCLASASTASATGPLVFGWIGCMDMPGVGGYNTASCTSTRNGGNYARAIFSFRGGLLGVCLWQGEDLGMYGNGACLALGGNFGYLPWWDPPALTVTVKGGAYKLESTLSGEKVKIACTSMQAKEPEYEDGGSKKEAGEMEAASLEYAGCAVESPAKCEVNSVGSSAKTIATNAVESKLVENSAKTKVEQLFKPKSGTVVGELEFKNKAAETCVLKGVKAKILGSTLTEGGAVDEIKDLDKIKLEDELGTEEASEAVEAAELISEPSSKKYFSDETEAEGEAKLSLLAEGKAAEPLTLLGEAKSEEHFAGSTFKNEETKEELKALEGPVDLGLERE